MAEAGIFLLKAGLSGTVALLVPIAAPLALGLAAL